MSCDRLHLQQALQGAHTFTSLMPALRLLLPITSWPTQATLPSATNHCRCTTATALALTASTAQRPPRRRCTASRHGGRCRTCCRCSAACGRRNPVGGGCVLGSGMLLCWVGLLLPLLLPSCSYSCAAAAHPSLPVWLLAQAICCLSSRTTTTTPLHLPPGTTLFAGLQRLDYRLWPDRHRQDVHNGGGAGGARPRHHPTCHWCVLEGRQLALN